MLEIEQRKLSRNSNGPIFSNGCPIWRHNISRRWKLNNGSSRENQIPLTFHSDVRFTCIIYRDRLNWTRKLWTNSNGHNFSRECMLDAHDISSLSKLKNRISQEIQMAITFQSDVRFMNIILREARNWLWKLSSKSNCHNLWLECIVDAHDILRRSKLNNKCSREIQMAITFHSDVRFTCIIYRDPRNWTRKLSGN